MKKSTHVAAVFSLALILHIALGWIWTPLAGVIGGIGGNKFAWRISAFSLGLSWSVLVMYNLVSANYQVMEMGRVMGELFGGFPGPLIFVFTVLIGLALGAVSGKLGMGLRVLIFFQKKRFHGERTAD